MTDEYIPPTVRGEIDDDYVRAINIFRRNNVTVKVPLKFEGQVVGEATCNPDGTITCELNQSRLGLKVHDVLTEGILDHLLGDREFRPIDPPRTFQGSVGFLEDPQPLPSQEKRV